MNLALGEALSRAGIKGTRSFEYVEKDLERQAHEASRPPRKSIGSAATATLKRLAGPGGKFDELWNDDRSKRFVTHMLHAFVPFSKVFEAPATAPCAACRRTPASKESKCFGTTESRSVLCPACWEEFKKWSEANKDKITKKPAV